MNGDWSTVIPSVEHLCLRVHAGDSVGTAFIVGTTAANGGCHTMLATALHVVQDILGNDQPLELIRNDGSAISELVNGPLRIYPVGPPECDTALIEIPTRAPLVTQEQLLAVPLATMLPRGASVGWLGYPGIVFPELCFFQGVVAGHQDEPPIYLIDGIAINGVSGGPAFDRSGLLVGLVSAYLPNRIDSNTTLPGLLIVTPSNLLRLWMQELLGAQVRHRESSN